MANEASGPGGSSGSNKKSSLSSTPTLLRGAVVPAGGVKGGKQPTPGYTPPPGSSGNIQAVGGTSVVSAKKKTTSSAQSTNSDAQRAAAEAQQRAEAARLEKEKRFNQDLEQGRLVKERASFDDAPTDPWTTPIRPVFPYDAELKLVASSSPLAHSIYLALTHEGLPLAFMKDTDYLKNFAAFGWDEEHDAIARQVLEKWKYIHANDFTSAEWVSSLAFFQDATTQDPLEQVYALYNDQLEMEIERLHALRNASNAAQIDTQIAALTRQQAALVNLGATSGSYTEIADVMETVFGYDVEFSGEFTSEERMNQLRNLAEANLVIVHYFDDLDIEIGLW